MLLKGKTTSDEGKNQGKKKVNSFTTGEGKVEGTNARETWKQGQPWDRVGVVFQSYRGLPAGKGASVERKEQGYNL